MGGRPEAAGEGEHAPAASEALVGALNCREAETTSDDSAGAEQGLSFVPPAAGGRADICLRVDRAGRSAGKGEGQSQGRQP